MKVLTATLAIVIALALAHLTRAADTHVRTVQVDSRTFPGLERMDGNWSALLAGSDGKVYMGLAYHGGSGHRGRRYDPFWRSHGSEVPTRRASRSRWKC